MLRQQLLRRTAAQAKKGLSQQKGIHASSIKRILSAPKPRASPNQERNVNETLKFNPPDSVGAREAIIKRLEDAVARGQLPPVRVLRPSVFCLIAAGLIYLGCAAYEVHQDVKATKAKLPVAARITFDMIEANGRNTRIQEAFHPMPPFDLSRPGATWNGLSGPNQVFATIAGLNMGLYALQATATPSLSYYLSHIPITNRNYTHFTSMFGHAGLAHLGLNLFALFNFGPAVAKTRTFEASGSHLTAFYLSAGLFSSLADHFSSILGAGRSRFIPAMGASGAIMAVLGAFAMSYPNAGVGIIFIPISIPAQYGFAALLAYETYGVVRGFSGSRIAHGAHLGGLLVGSAYVYINGKKNIWTPTRRFAYNQMARLNMI
ncbi:hypothetical protein NA57DRAFT_56821 [Rhizodiscina lignyota]|uniref:Peptidase S54 rhomboid domain-containing protein n=1 Tax=Rhizodiscina lignyota TaxID=1504668 RepID=A0A9P4M9C1_9PEZI|nr:hypothetical protein NA57DRAFT_56821 [Rhizodiscina lignyota]